MILKKRYDELMDKIQVTDEMRSRILTNLQNSTLEGKTSFKFLPIFSVRKYVSIAACLALLLLSSLVLPKVIDNNSSYNEQILTNNWSVQEYSSFAELEATLPFEIQEIKNLPFTATKQTYIAYGSDMAEILYENDEQTACFRISKGQEDNSGDYTDYAQSQELSVEKLIVTLKGENDTFVLAVWSDGSLSYSLSLSTGISIEAWESLLLAQSN